MSAEVRNKIHAVANPHGDGVSTRPAVVVTGSSSGIGRAITLRLANSGFAVFAGVRKAQDAESLAALGNGNLLPINPLDLTRGEDIRQAVERVSRLLSEQQIDGIDGIVHCAGGSAVAPIELTAADVLRTELETRVTGPVELTKLLLPALRLRKGRIIWISTPALIPIAFVSSIHACDFAVNCVARTLNLELRQWGITNVLVRCGGIDTTSPQKAARKLDSWYRQWDPQTLELYRKVLDEERARLSEFDTGRSSADKVAAVVHRALTTRKPKSRYQVGHMSAAAAFLELLPQPLVDSIMAARMS